MSSAEQAPFVDSGELLRRARRLARLSQRELAERAGIAVRTVERIEAGSVWNPGVGTVRSLLAAAGCDLDVVRRDGAEGAAGAVVIAPHPYEGSRDLAGRRHPAHVELTPVRGMYEPAPVEWSGWAYRSSPRRDGSIPSVTFSRSRGRYYQPDLDPATGLAREQCTILDAGERLDRDADRWQQAMQFRRSIRRRGGRGVARIGVFALQGDVREHARALESAGCEAVPVRRPSELAAVDGLVLPGGESTTMIKLARTFDLLEPLRDRIASGMPAYGSCAGMILLADRVDTEGSPLSETIGGLDITVRRNAFGRQVDSFEEDIEIDGVEGDPVRAVFIRAPWVQEVGPKASPLGATAAGHVVAVRQGTLLATSFHPEMTGDGRVHAYFCAMVAGEV